VIDASPAAITCRKPSTASAPREPAQVFPANAAAADGRPWMDGVMGWSRIRDVAKDRFCRHHRPRDPQPQFPCRSPPKALGPAARRP
jgi:hypothetical protein